MLINTKFCRIYILRMFFFRINILVTFMSQKINNRFVLIIALNCNFTAHNGC